ncbi:MAG: M24 family metallopeptidase, partial [Myxococcota bacterium]
MKELSALYSAHVTTLVDRTTKALEHAGYERLVIHAGDLVLHSRFDDREFPFSPVPAFSHWVPWPWPGSALVIEKGRTARLCARRRTDFWERLEAPHAELVAQALDVEMVDDLGGLADFARKPGTAFIGETVASGVKLGFDEARINPHTLVEALHDTRVKKTPYEVECVAQANRRAARGHVAIREAFAAGGRDELALHLTYLAAIEQSDAEAPYQGIVALGEAASVLHHHHYGVRPEAQSLLVDAGAQVRGYAADITRTYAAPGSAPEFEVLIEGMDRLQKEVCRRIEVGKNYEALHDETHDLLGGLLVEHGLVTCSAEAAVGEGLTRVFFPHGLGHSLGVQVHDV